MAVTARETLIYLRGFRMVSQNYQQDSITVKQNAFHFFLAVMNMEDKNIVHFVTIRELLPRSYLTKPIFETLMKRLRYWTLLQLKISRLSIQKRFPVLVYVYTHEVLNL